MEAGLAAMRRMSTHQENQEKRRAAAARMVVGCPERWAMYS